MSDRYGAEIHIGGALPKEKVEEFLNICCDEQALMSYSYEPTEKNLKECYDNLSSLYLGSGEARNGEFEDLEEWCRKNYLCYKRTSSSYYDWPGEVVWWSPSISRPGSLVCDDSGSPYVTLSDLKTYLEGGSTLKDIIKELDIIPKIPPLIVLE